MRKLSESVWGDIRKKSLGQEERREDDFGNIKELKPVNIGGQVLWADKDFELKDGTYLFDIGFAKEFGVVNGWRIPTLEESKVFNNSNNQISRYSNDDEFIVDDGRKGECICFKKRGSLDHNGVLIDENEYYAWTIDFKYAQAFGFYTDVTIKMPVVKYKFRIHVNKHDNQYCIRLVRDKK